ncbi:gene transfer agent family protein [Nitratireductor thuwali]|uniref:Transfer Agent n=1 Tax=Nitratireductor thuwali TaxID=2267699 RepID=A0ABY5MLR8_9HYPH|nr:hypothetical protein NTH_03406 [Nitratireductor thuwali]
MSVNRRRGEVAARLDGREYRLCLTLGALAELEAAFAVADLNALVARLGEGRMAAADIVAIIGAGLRGGGHELSDADVRTMRCEDGAAGFARLAGELLAVTFGASEGAQQADTPNP